MRAEYDHHNATWSNDGGSLHDDDFLRSTTSAREKNPKHHPQPRHRDRSNRGVPHTIRNNEGQTTRVDEDRDEFNRAMATISLSLDEGDEDDIPQPDWTVPMHEKFFNRGGGTKGTFSR